MKTLYTREPDPQAGAKKIMRPGDIVQPIRGTDSLGDPGCLIRREVGGAVTHIVVRSDRSGARLRGCEMID